MEHITVIYKTSKLRLFSNKTQKSSGTMREKMRARTCRCAVNFSMKHISDICSKLTFGHFGLSSLSLFLIAKKVKITVVMTSTRKSNAYEPVIRFIIFVVSYFLFANFSFFRVYQLKPK